MKFLVSWFVHHGVAANLLMLLIVIGGLATIPRLRQEIFPELSSDTITISAAYLGASPEEAEEGVCVRVEEAIQGLPGIKRIRSTALEGMGTVTIEVLEDADIRHLLEEVKARDDAIETFPEETEKPVVQEVLMRRQVIDLAVHGETDEATLRKAAERVRDEEKSPPGRSVCAM